MLDDWLERMLREPPERRAKRQLRELNTATRTTVTQLREHPNDHQTPVILHKHDTQVARIMQRGRKPAPKRCRICGKVLPGPPRDFWTNNTAIKLLWAVCIAVLVVILSQVIDWWALVVFPIGWLISLSFWWTIAIPSLLMVFLALVLGFSGILS
jgi:hypothetical protein